MKTILNALLVLAVVVLTGCDEPPDSRINMDDEVRSDTLASNYITRPIGDALSALFGEGIDVKRVLTRTNEAGFMEVHVQGFNRSSAVKRFEYRVEWLDAQGIVIESAATTWLPVSAKGKSQFSFKSVAPSRQAVDFRIDTRK
jgi:uncharacterized protein YcfL